LPEKKVVPQWETRERKAMVRTGKALAGGTNCENDKGGELVETYQGGKGRGG